MADRREFIGSVAGCVLAAPFAGTAQPSARLPRIGILANYEGPPWDGLRRGLRELGYVEGRTLLIEWRWADGRTDRYPARDRSRPGGAGRWSASTRQRGESSSAWRARAISPAMIAPAAARPSAVRAGSSFA